LRKWIVRHRPSPGTTFGFAALVIALGGVAFAAIPDSSGTIHGCYQKSNGSLRIVESASDCRSSERAISWSAGSQPASGVVARASSAGAVTSNSPQPFRPEEGTPIPLIGNTWTQRPDETNEIYGVVDFTPPPACNSFGSTGFLAVTFFIDGQLAGGAASHGITDEQVLVRKNDNYVYEPGSSDARTLTATAADTCQDGNHFTVDSVRVSVVGIR
jgi:hypothetical protein